MTSNSQPKLEKGALKARDKHYDNPQSDLILISSDLVGLRVDSWAFAERSQLVRDLLAVSSKQRLVSAAIPLDHSASTVRYFIDLVLCRSGTLDIEANIDDFHQIFKLCDRFDAPDVTKNILNTLRLRVRGRDYPAGLDAWELFKIAANQDDEDLATAAIHRLQTCGHTHKSLVFDNPAEFMFADMPPRYQVAFFKCAFRVQTRRFEEVQTWEPNSLDDMAKLFRLE